ncbi:MAG TPA: tryptophan synthase subunit alpha [Arenimonas sp.]|nr:tryptophan synthase subunit alpha [Arenimonas sp.]
MEANRIEQKIAQLKSRNKKALVPFITAGDPGLEHTVAILHALVQSGADMIELGVPFSDPMADGVVIQKSSERALALGVNASYIFQTVEEFRKQDTETPIILMGYLNPIERRGWNWYAEQAVNAGVDALLIVDLPPEEAVSVREMLAPFGIQLISLLAPTTDGIRLADTCQHAQGYLYYVSMNGVTGKGLEQAGDLKERIDQIKALSNVPVFVGFGIKDADTARSCAQFADGVIIGSALVSRLAECSSDKACQEVIQEFLPSIRTAIDLV